MIPRFKDLLAEPVLGDFFGDQFCAVDRVIDVATVQFVAFNREIHNFFGQLLNSRSNVFDQLIGILVSIGAGEEHNFGNIEPALLHCERWRVLVFGEVALGALSKSAPPGAAVTDV